MGSGFDCSLDCRSCNYILKFCFSQLKQTRPATAWFWLSKQTRWPPHIFPRGRRNKQTSVSRVCFSAVQTNSAGHSLFLVVETNSLATAHTRGRRNKVNSVSRVCFSQLKRTRRATICFWLWLWKQALPPPATFPGAAETNKLLSAEFVFRYSNKLARPQFVFGCRNKLVGHRIYACHFPRGRRNKQTSVSRVVFPQLKQTRPATSCFWLSKQTRWPPQIRLPLS